MFLRLVADSFRRRPRHKLLTGAALALGMAVATAALSVSLDVGDRLSHEFRSLGANILVTPQADTLPLEIGGVDYRPVNAGAYLRESDLPKIKTVFWHNNIIAFAPILEVPVQAWTKSSQTLITPAVDAPTSVIGTWASYSVALPDGGTFATAIEKTNPWWRLAAECVVGTKFAKRDGLKLGDTVNIKGPSQAIQLKVTGILTTGGPEDDAIVAPIAISR